MNKRIIRAINQSLEKLDTSSMTPSQISIVKKRLSEELDWFDADPGRSSCLQLLSDLTSKIRSAGVVLSPGYGYLTDSFIFYLAKIHSVNPLEWDLPFSRFTRSFKNGCTIPVEAGTGVLEIAREVLCNRDEFIIEKEPGVFEITFLDGEELINVTIRIYQYGVLDRFNHTLKKGWRKLDNTSLRLFRRSSTDETIWFESDKMREWLFEFEPESMSDLCLLNAIYYPGRIVLFDEINKRKHSQELIPSTGNSQADSILSESYGIIVYQEQLLLLTEIGHPVSAEFKELAVKGHTIARTMISIESIVVKKKTTTLK